LLTRNINILVSKLEASPIGKAICFNHMGQDEPSCYKPLGNLPPSVPTGLVAAFLRPPGSSLKVFGQPTIVLVAPYMSQNFSNPPGAPVASPWPPFAPL